MSSSKAKAVDAFPSTESRDSRVQGSSSSVNVARSTLVKLALFTVAMICLPIGTYFYSVDRFFEGNATYAGISAAVMANVVLIAYVIAAVLEDSNERSPVNIKKRQ